MNNIFFINEFQNYKSTYEDLLNDLNQLKTVDYLINSKNPYQLFLKIIGCIITNNDCVILDSDFSEKEIETYSSSLKNPYQQKNIIINIKNKSELLEKITNSKSSLSLFTSGTTGQPKIIKHKITNFITSVKNDNKFKTNIWAFAFNPTHMAGLQVFFQGILNLNPFVYLFNQTKEKIIPLLIKYKVTHISATPSFYKLLLPVDFKINTVQKVTIGGERSDTFLYEKIQLMFPSSKISNIYASTEAGALFYSSGDIFLIKDNLKQEVKIINNILYFSTSILGESNEMIDEWYNTGDMVEIISENPLQIKFLSRESEIINVGGNNVNPFEVESCLNQHPYILKSMVFGRKTSLLGNIIACEIELQAEKSINEKTLREFLSSMLQDYKIPRIIKIVDKIQLTRTGKIKRN